MTRVVLEFVIHRLFAMVRPNDVAASGGVVSVDWFALSCRLARPWPDCVLCPPAGCSSVRLTPTAVWSERWYILDADGNKVCTLLAVPRSWKISADRCLIEVANRWLYYDDFHSRLDEILGMLPLVVDGLNRVDLCCDFEMSEGQYDTYLKLADGRAYAGAYKSGVCWWSDIDGKRVPHQLSWGGKDSVLHWKVYYKFKELQDAAAEDAKPYIVDTWKQCGLNPPDVWRCEVSVAGSRNLVSVDNNRPLAFRDWYDMRTDLWASLYSTRFVVRKSEGHKDKRNDTELTFLSVDGRRLLRCALPSASRDGSDPERRLLSKLWAEYQQVDVAANAVLAGMLRGNICRLCERPDNWLFLMRISGLDATALSNAILDAPMVPSVGTTE